MTFGEKMFNFYETLPTLTGLPAGVEVLNPYAEESVRGYVRSYFDKYYRDNHPRILVFGINPGRFGAGLTGISFTDPVALREHCGIENTLQQKKELSSEFIYKVIQAYGGEESFFYDFFMTAISPLGFIKESINYNYYDDKTLQEALSPFIIESIQQQLDMGVHRHTAILLGTGKNQKFFTDLNNEHQFFKEVYALEHPRYIMQYKRKYMDNYIEKYQEVFRKAKGNR